MGITDLLAYPDLGIALLPTLGMEVDQNGQAMLTSPYGRTPMVSGALELAPVLARLAIGNVCLAELRDAAMAVGGVSATARLYRILHLLTASASLHFHLGNHSVLAVLQPQAGGVLPDADPIAADEAFTLSRFALIRREGAAAILESPRALMRFELVHAKATQFIMSFAGPALTVAAAGSAAQLDQSLACRLAGLLAAQHFLVAAAPGSAPVRAEGGDPALTQWDFHDLLLHARSRTGRHHDMIGGVYPYVGEVDPLPAVRPTWAGPRTILPRPDLARLAVADPTFTEVLERRRSIRTLDDKRPVTVAELGEFLFRVARLKQVQTILAGFPGRQTTAEVAWRPYPSGGAIFETELYLAVRLCEGLEPGLYHYDTAEHALALVREDDAEVRGFIADAAVSAGNMMNPQLVFELAARFQRVAWKYRGIAYGIMLRNVGALYQTMYLAATAMGLAPCGLGNGNIARFARATGLAWEVEGTIGEFALGRPAASE